MNRKLVWLACAAICLIAMTSVVQAADPPREREAKPNPGVVKPSAEHGEIVIYNADDDDTPVKDRPKAKAAKPREAAEAAEAREAAEGRERHDREGVKAQGEQGQEIKIIVNGQELKLDGAQLQMAPGMMMPGGKLPANAQKTGGWIVQPGVGGAYGDWLYGKMNPVRRPKGGEAEEEDEAEEHEGGRGFGMIGAGRLGPGEQKYGFLGIGIIGIPMLLADHLGLDDGRGVVVEFVQPGSPAAQGGLAHSDVITMVDDQIIYAVEQLKKLVAAHKPGATVRVQFIHRGRVQATQVRLAGTANRSWGEEMGEHPEMLPLHGALPHVGMTMPMPQGGMEWNNLGVRVGPHPQPGVRPNEVGTWLGRRQGEAREEREGREGPEGREGREGREGYWRAMPDQPFPPGMRVPPVQPGQPMPPGMRVPAPMPGPFGQPFPQQGQPRTERRPEASTVRTFTVAEVKAAMDQIKAEVDEETWYPLRKKLTAMDGAKLTGPQALEILAPLKKVVSEESWKFLTDTFLGKKGPAARPVDPLTGKKQADVREREEMREKLLQRRGEMSGEQGEAVEQLERVLKQLENAAEQNEGKVEGRTNPQQGREREELRSAPVPPKSLKAPGTDEPKKQGAYLDQILVAPNSGMAGGFATIKIEGPGLESVMFAYTANYEATWTTTVGKPMVVTLTDKNGKVLLKDVPVKEVSKHLDGLDAEARVLLTQTMVNVEGVKQP